MIAAAVRCSPQGASPLHPDPLLSCQKGGKALAPAPAPQPAAGVPCAARSGRPGMELAAFAALTPLRHPSRVSSRSALTRAPDSAALLGSSNGANSRAANSRETARRLWHRGLFGIRLWAARLFAPFGSAEQHSQLRRGRQPASSTDSARLSDRSERSERREFRAGRAWRAAQGTTATGGGEGCRGGRFWFLLARQKELRVQGGRRLRALTQDT